MKTTVMTPALYNYDIFPKVFIEGENKLITVRPLGRHVAFTNDFEYTVRLFKSDQGSAKSYPDRPGRYEFKAKPDEDGCLRFNCTLEGEGEYFVRIFDDPESKTHIVQFSVYSLLEDMRGRIPLRGDLHLHSGGSRDGCQAPEVFAADYRGNGYDFMVISDHYKFYPALEAVELHDGLTDLNIVPGEEVHLPLSNAHYVNFGNSFSINALVTPNRNQEKAGDDLKYRSLDGNAPDPITLEEYTEMINERAKQVPREQEAERINFAIFQWIYENIQKGGGLGIFPHPFWVYPQMHVPEDFTEFIYREKPFDAFEVIGGGSSYAINGFQTGFYYDMKAKGVVRPVVGSTDSHTSTEYYKENLRFNNLTGSTIVFAKANTREELIRAIKESYSVAVDTLDPHYRLVGDYRLMKYGSFLMEHYFPLHDLACKAEGYYAKQYLTAKDERALNVLKALKGQIPEMQKKYFAV